MMGIRKRRARTKAASEATRLKRKVELEAASSLLDLCDESNNSHQTHSNVEACFDQPPRGMPKTTSSESIFNLNELSSASVPNIRSETQMFEENCQNTTAAAPLRKAVPLRTISPNILDTLRSSRSEGLSQRNPELSAFSVHTKKLGNPRVHAWLEDMKTSAAIKTTLGCSAVESSEDKENMPPHGTVIKAIPVRKKASSTHSRSSGGQTNSHGGGLAAQTRSRHPSAEKDHQNMRTRTLDESETAVNICTMNTLNLMTPNEEDDKQLETPSVSSNEQCDGFAEYSQSGQSRLGTFPFSDGVGSGETRSISSKEWEAIQQGLLTCGIELGNLKTKVPGKDVMETLDKSLGILLQTLTYVQDHPSAQAQNISADYTLSPLTQSLLLKASTSVMFRMAHHPPGFPVNKPGQ